MKRGRVSSVVAVTRPLGGRLKNRDWIPGKGKRFNFNAVRLSMSCFSTTKYNAVEMWTQTIQSVKFDGSKFSNIVRDLFLLKKSPDRLWVPARPLLDEYREFLPGDKSDYPSPPGVRSKTKRGHNSIPPYDFLACRGTNFLKFAVIANVV